MKTDAMIEIHPNAISNINEKGDSLVLAIETRTKKRVEVKEDNPNTESYVDFKFDRSMLVGDMIGHEQDAFGKILSIFVDEEYIEYGFFNENYAEYELLCKKIYKIKNINTQISFQTISQLVFKWIIAKFRRQEKLFLCEYLIIELNPKIKNRTIYVPINGLKIKEIQFGKIFFKIITKEFIDKWEEQEKSGVTKPESIDLVEERFNDIRRSMQGHSVAVYNITAESIKAFEMAREEVGLTLSLLRFYSSPSLKPGFVSCCTILGCENIETIRMYEVKNDIIADRNESIIGKSEHHWHIDEKYFQIMVGLGLGKLHKILVNEILSDFQKKLFQALQLYSKALLMKDITDQIIYRLIALETMLLKNQDESIVQNISERLAIYIGEDIQSKRRIIKIVKEIYDIRSKYVHHGDEFENYNLLKEFYDLIYRFFFNLIIWSDQIESKEIFIQSLDDRKLI